jgi:hypothetical protein
VKIGDKVWIMLPPSFYKARKIEAEVKKIGTKYFYAQPTTDDTYKTHTIRIERKTLREPGPLSSWRAYLAEAECDAVAKLETPYVEARELFNSVLDRHNLAEADATLCTKIIELLEQHRGNKNG